jgi:UDP-N-acetylglucosamine 2-epimerase (non-hydrolysing)
LNKKILCVVGARPNLMKIAPVIAALKAGPAPFEVCLLHTGQHYDTAMNDQFFTALGIPRPNINLDVGSASHAVQTSEIMRRFEPVLDQEAPDAILVVGDVNSTIACALVAAKKNVKVIHVEAGLRSYDRGMPEEINRVLTDQISDILFTTEREAEENLRKEGIAGERVHFVGNVMIDTLKSQLPHATPVSETLRQSGVSERLLDSKNGYAILTLHRPSNVDDTNVLRTLLRAVADVSRSVPVIFPVHPRTRGRIESFGLMDLITDANISLLPPQGYLEMLGLMKDARLVLTDSGGIQEETTALGVPCITLRHNTERPITVTEGTNTIVGTDPEKIKTAVRDILQTGGKAGKSPEYWDGKAAQRIAAVLHAWLDQMPRRQVA